jgi:hypothetical protein
MTHYLSDNDLGTWHGQFNHSVDNRLLAPDNTFGRFPAVAVSEITGSTISEITGSEITDLGTDLGTLA